MRILLLALLVANAAASPGDEASSLQFFKDLAETRNYTLGRPLSPKITPDGAAVIYLRAAPREPVLRLYEFSLNDRRERELLSPEQILGAGEEQLSPEEKARRERQRQSLKGFTSYQLSGDGTRLLVALSGKLYVVDRASLGFFELPGENWIDPRFSPDGRFIAGVKDRELHVIDLAAKSVTAVTSGSSGTVSHGTSEFVAQEEMGRNEGYWWSPDSSTLLYQETDESEVEVRYIHNPLNPADPPSSFRYPKAGTKNANVRIGFVSRGGGPTRWVNWDAARFPYLARVVWNHSAAPLTILVQNREQTEQALLRVDPANGETATVLFERDPAWLNLDDHDYALPRNGGFKDASITTPLWLDGGKSFLWTTEARGFWQVHLHDADGRLVRELTPTDFIYRGIVGVDERGGHLFVRGSRDSREVHLWRFSLDGSKPPLQLTDGFGQHSAVYGNAARKLVHALDLFDGTYGCHVLDVDGKRIATIPSNAERPARWPTTELVFTNTQPALDAAVTRPAAFDPAVKYPVIVVVYGGPHAKRVNASGRDYFLDQWMADLGYVVVRMDGRGTPWKGRDWERVIKGNFIDLPLNDQISGLQALGRQYPEMDLSRVGMTGWSFGGYFSAMASIRRPDVFRAGVAGAPVITWENYDTHYTERYLGLPQAHPEAYEVSNVTTYVDKTERPILLIHGITDDNVYFQHTMQLADAMFYAGKPYELLPMSGTHMISDPVVRLRRETRIMDFFERHVKNAK